MNNLIQIKKKRLIKYLDSIAREEGWPLSDRCKALLMKSIKYVSLKRGEYLLTPGHICKNLYFIEKGLLKCFYAKGKKTAIDWMLAELEAVVALDSFYDQVPGKDWIEAHEDCQLLYISYDELNELYRTCVEFNAVGRVFTNKYLRIWHTHARNLRLMTKMERYQLMLESQPELVKRVQVKDLASYLDMNPATLTRQRTKLKKQPKPKPKPQPKQKPTTKKK